ncbi:hypothetical protein SAMN05880593_111123 [Rhizobium sp. RU36D]|nr:hypothetical protein SAMN05880593_111123 [Rhizobium sp. RU36D]
MKDSVEGFHYGVSRKKAGYHGAMKEVLGDKVSLALDMLTGVYVPWVN